jgi:hypothetical protein
MKKSELRDMIAEEIQALREDKANARFIHVKIEATVELENVKVKRGNDIDKASKDAAKAEIERNLSMGRTDHSITLDKVTRVVDRDYDDWNDK